MSASRSRAKLIWAAALAVVAGVALAGVATAQGPDVRQGTNQGTGTSTGTGPGPPDTRVDFRVDVRRKQKLAPSLKLSLTCLEVCRAEVGGTLTVRVRAKGKPRKARNFKIPQQSVPLGVGAKASFNLKLSKRARKAALFALRHRGSAQAKIAIHVQDLAGNSANQNEPITVKRKRSRS